MKTLIEYGKLTIRDLVNLVNENKTKFPKGLDTQITCGDYEGNYNHVNMSVEDWWSGRPSSVMKLHFELND